VNLAKTVFLLSFLLALFGCTSAPDMPGDVYAVLLSPEHMPKPALYVADRAAHIPENITFKGFVFPAQEGSFSNASFGGRPVTLVDKVWFNKLFDLNCHLAWATFHRHYPGANVLLKLSDVGFNQSRTQAVIYVEAIHVGDARRNCLGGEGFYVSLSKVHGKWVIAKKEHLWVS
jgi:hypothetical protein